MRERFIQRLRQRAQVLNLHSSSPAGCDLILYLEHVAQQLEQATKKLDDRRVRLRCNIMRSCRPPRPHYHNKCFSQRDFFPLFPAALHRRSVGM